MTIETGRHDNTVLPPISEPAALADKNLISEQRLHRIFAVLDRPWKIVGLSLIFSAVLTMVLTYLFFGSLDSALLAVLIASLCAAPASYGLGRLFLSYQAIIEAKNSALEAHTATLRRTNRELQQSNADLRAFAHMVAHDLKSPVGNIIGHTTLLRDNWQRLTIEQIDQSTTAAASAAFKMNHIIEDLLLLASVRDEQLIVAPLAMSDIVDQVMERMADMISQYEAVVNLPASWPEAFGHAPWIEGVWVNYISNGLKYGGQPPAVALGADEPAGGFVRFWVRDNGPGIAPVDQARLFQPFNRFDKRPVTGHGLGLSIVKRIAERLGGEVGVISTPGTGSEFYFTLPTGEKQ